MALGLLLLMALTESCGGRVDQSDIVIENGPLKGKKAIWDKDIKAFIIHGDTSKAKQLVEYKRPACTNGVIFRHCPSTQPEFSNIHLEQDNIPLPDKKSLYGTEGFGFISADSESLNGRTTKMSERAGWVICFHPALENSAKELFRVIDQEDWNQFETGLLLGYAEVDTYTWVFGTKEAEKFYKQEKFNEIRAGYEYSKSLSWRQIGKNRLKKVIPPSEYKYVVAEYPPIGDSVFESKK